MDRYRKLVTGLLVLMAFVPFVLSYHHRPIPTFYQELLTLTLGVVLIVLIAWRQGLSFGPAILSPLVFLAVVAAQFLAGRTLYSHDVLNLGICIIWGVLLAAALVRFFREQPVADVLPVLAMALLAAGVVNAVAALLQVSVAGVPGVFYAPHQGVYGNIASPNNLVTYLSISVISAIYLAGERRLPRMALIPALGLIALAIVISSQRSALLYLIWIGASFLLLGRFGRNSGRSLAMGVFVAWLGFWQLLHPWLVTVLPGLYDASLLERFKQAGLYDGFRVGYLRVAWSMFVAHPLLGAGLGSWDQWVFWQPLGEGATTLMLSNSEHAHNIVAHLGAELGIAAVVPLLLMLWVLWKFRPGERATGWWVWCVAGVFILHSLIEYPLWYVHFLGIFVIVMAMALASGRWLPGPSFALRGAAALFALAFVAGLAVMVPDYYRLENYPLRMRGGEISRAFQEITRNPLLGTHARSWLGANMNPAPVRLPEKLAICRRSLAEWADAYVIRGCTAVYRSAGLHEEADRLRERMLRNPVHEGLEKAIY